MIAIDHRLGHNEVLAARAEEVMPGACLGLFQLPRDRTVVIANGHGPYLWDVEGNRYIDYVLRSGPMLIGHTHPAVVQAVQEQAAKGSMFYTLNEPVIELSHAIVDAVASGEAIKYVSTAHGNSEVDRTREAVEGALRALKTGRG